MALVRMGSAALAACLAAPLAAQDAPEALFLCDGGETARVAFGDGTASIAVGDGAPVTLSAAPAGSGFLYEGDGGSLRGQGAEIIWQAEGADPLRCDEVAGGGELVGPLWQVAGFAPEGEAMQVPRAPETLTLEFLADGRVSAQLDCNRGSGGWSAEPAAAGEGGALAFGPMAVTRAACMEGDGMVDRFAASLGDIDAYMREGTTLSLMLRDDGGTWTFEAQDAAN